MLLIRIILGVSLLVPVGCDDALRFPAGRDAATPDATVVTDAAAQDSGSAPPDAAVAGDWYCCSSDMLGISCNCLRSDQPRDCMSMRPVSATCGLSFPCCIRASTFCLCANNMTESECQTNLMANPGAVRADTCP